MRKLGLFDGLCIVATLYFSGAAAHRREWPEAFYLLAMAVLLMWWTTRPVSRCPVCGQ